MFGIGYLVFLLTVLTACAVVTVLLALSASLKLNRLSGRLNALLDRANRAGHRLETVIQRSCRTASGVLDQIERVREQAGSFFGKRNGRLFNRKGGR